MTNRVRLMRPTPVAPIAPVTGLNDPNIENFPQVLEAFIKAPLTEIDDMFNSDSPHWQGKEKQEVMFKLTAWLDGFPELNGYNMCVGNFNKGTAAPAPNRRAMFYKSNGRPVNLQSGGDKSDLTAMRDGEILATTSKNLASGEIGKLDVDKIHFVFDNSVYKTSGRKLRLCVVVRCREELDRLIENAHQDSSAAILKYLTDPSTLKFDQEDIRVASRKIKERIAGLTMDDILNYNDTSRHHLDLRPHQKLALAETAAIRATGVRDVVWGQVPRSGKSYIMAAFIAADARDKTACNYIIITTAPNETLSQYEETLRCADLREFNVLRLPHASAADLGAKNIVICSKQYLQTKFDKATDATEAAAPAAADTKAPGRGRGKTGRTGNGARSIKAFFAAPVVADTAHEWLAAMRFDARFIDESHYGGATNLARQTLVCFGADAFTVFVTATYAKPAKIYGVPTDRCVVWDLADVADAKRFTNTDARDRIFTKHPLAVSAFTGTTPYKMSKIYQDQPHMVILTHKLTPETIAKLRDAPEDISKIYGWSPKGCLLLKDAGTDKKGNKRTRKPEFQDRASTLTMLADVFGPPLDEFKRPMTPDTSFMRRARDACDRLNPEARFMLDPAGTHDAEPTVVIAFLPADNVDMTSTALKALIDSENALPEYGVCIINSKQTDDPKKTILDARNRAKNDHKRALLVLSGRQCSLGVTIPGCDVVVFLNGTGANDDEDSGSDMVYQMMFRGMTEAPGKRLGFVFDLDIRRSLRAVIANLRIPSAPGTKTTVRRTVANILTGRVISLNPDHWDPLFCGGSGETEAEIAEIYAAAAEKYADSVYAVYTAREQRTVSEWAAMLKFKSDTLKLDECALMRELVSLMPGTLRKAKDFIKRRTAAEVPNGIESTRVKGSGENTDPAEEAEEVEEAESSDDEPEENVLPTTEDMMRNIVPFMVLMTVQTDATTLREMYNIVVSDPLRKEILMDHTQPWRQGDESMRIVWLLLDIFEEHFESGQEHDIIGEMKAGLVAKIDNAAELSRIIDEIIVPLESEKKANAEVSTPAPLRAAILNRIPAEIWTAVHRILEPCAGKGGFLVDMIDRFMAGLAPIIPDLAERKRVILEECLFWGDINAFNILVCRLLLDPYGKYDIKVYKGDSLALDPVAQWGVAAFDAVVGNPPYQKENKKNGAAKGGTNNHLYLEFALYAMNLLAPDGLLVFVHPLNWRKIGSKVLPEFAAKRDLVFLALVSGGEMFANVSVKTDYYVLRNSRRDDNVTIIECAGATKDAARTEASVVIPRDVSFIPNRYDPEIASALHKIHTRGAELKCICESDCHKTREYVHEGRTDEFRYPLYNTSGNPYPYFSSRPHKEQTSPKVLMSNSGKLGPFYDAGEFGATQDAMYIKVESEAEGATITRFLKSALAAAVVKLCQWGNFRNEVAVVSYMTYPPVDALDYESTNYEAELRAFYGITDEEARAIGAM